jgi:hypothetical protein
MSEENNEMLLTENLNNVPNWYNEYVDKLVQSGRDITLEAEEASKMSSDKLNEHLGGKINDLPYEVLRSLLPNGSDDENVGAVLSGKRAEYLKNHKDEYKGNHDAGKGVITYDGRFISKQDWDSATDSEKRAIMVGSTCFHFNSDTPGMGSDPKDRW